MIYLVSSQSPRPQAGFALIASLTIMAVLVMIAVALYTMSSVATQSAKMASARVQAQANAKVALMQAIGELQKQLGPDQRVSANGSIRSTAQVNHPHWSGVWDSWIAGEPSDAPVGAAYPSAASHHQTIGEQPSASMHPDYANKDAHFRRWLTSLDPGEATDPATPVSAALRGVALPEQNAEAIRLVGPGSLGESADASDFVSARLKEIASPSPQATPRSRYAWWVGDESQKARIMADSYDTASTLTDAERIYRAQAPGSMGNKRVPGLESITDEQQLAKLGSYKTLDLIKLDTPSGDDDPRLSQINFHDLTIFSRGVLADVREGGLKRDLNTILEQPIRLEDSGDEFMLYRFDTEGEDRVPIQDLAAYYQLYEDDPAWNSQKRGGIQYTSRNLNNAIQVEMPDYDGGKKDKEKFLREYSSLYRSAVPIRVQFLLAVGGVPITAEERAARPNMRPTDTHKLLLGVMPVITLWNPNSVPLVMRHEQTFRLGTPPFGIRWRKYRADGSIFDNGYFNLNYAMGGDSVSDGRATRLSPFVVQFTFAKTRPIVFEPGEVKMFSIDGDEANKLSSGGTNVSMRYTRFEPVNRWDPFGILVANRAALVSSRNRDTFVFDNDNDTDMHTIVFNPNDKFSIEINTESRNPGRNVAAMSEVFGGGFQFYMFDSSFGYWRDRMDFLRNYQFMSRFGGGTSVRNINNTVFNAELMEPAFPGGEAPIEVEEETNAIPGSQIINATNAGEVIGIMDFTLAAGSESSAQSLGGFGGGRRIASRPFLHGGIIAPPFIDKADPASLYTYGWDWHINRINNVEDSVIQGEPGTGKGFYGGGYTIEAGTTNVVQQQTPVLPPISIAGLSHAHLGGFSLAEAGVINEDPYTQGGWWKSARIRNPQGKDYRQVMATGNAGLGPRVMQAVGNSYAHPSIPADQAFTSVNRWFDLDVGNEEVTYADHSYLSNKALWDDYFFSSITPQLAKVELFETAERTAEQVAEDFFFSNQPLPNRRIKPYRTNLDEQKLGELFTEKEAFNDGLADKIAAHLLVEGPFNINSTSVEAWKVLLTSLKGKPVSHLDGAGTQETTPTGTPVFPGMLPTAAAISSGGITNSNMPPEQWTSGRELSDEEIGQLATAIVKQVRARGPFLSMSEFVNRRLEGSNSPQALKGALQAALDDPSVSINANFRTPARMLDDETAGIAFAFPEAAKGPIAYGSNAYVDQADVLRHFAEQLTPRGDTFVIRSYGDALGSNGKVTARAWCEAIVQRVPEYVNPEDEPHLKQADPALSDASKRFGRKFQIIGFRWLNPEEV